MSTLDNVVNQFQRADEETAARNKAAQLHVPYINLVGYPVLPNTLKLIPLTDCEKWHIVPYLRVENKLKLATTDPKPETIGYLQDFANKNNLEVTLALCSETSLNFLLNLYRLQNKQHQTSVDVNVNTQSQENALTIINTPEELQKKIATANASTLLELLFSAATGMEASDIHLEPQEDTIRVRFRIDGVLQEVTTLQAALYKSLVSRIKYLAQIKLDISHVNQDGRFTVSLGDTELDIRVGTLPSAYGEIIEMRLLRPHNQLIKLSDLGLSAAALQAIQEAVSQPHGMFLVTGPTGSGKTTTLYAVLDTLNKTGVKIITLEDPIEYRVKGIDQVQIDIEHNFDYPQALKGVLRQDPDIIMAGEIRDKLTADIGLQAAMTGHLFLTTLHTNNAPASLARLIDMGIEPYKIAGAINLIIAQRLVRKVCSECHGTGCEVCHKTGYKGRMPIIEFLKPNEALDAAILRQASVRELYEIAVQNDMVPMREDGLAKVALGLTTEEEVNRVTSDMSV